MCCLCVEMGCPCVPPAVAYLREVIPYGPLEPLGLLNHFLMFSSLSRCCCWCGLTGFVLKEIRGNNVRSPQRQ